nr:bZIP transcription factor [Lilium sp.]
MNYKNMGSSDPTPLARLQSVYSLTLDEFQNTISGMGLAKDFGSMNMDEFLKNIWTAEENQAMASTSASAATAAAAAAGGGGLQRQGSLTLPRTISQKTVDEVWRDFGGQREFQQQQPSFGEMTLEEFLVRAGVVREDVINQQPALPAPAPIFAATTTTGANNNNGMFYSDMPMQLPSSSRKQGLSLTFSRPGPSNGSVISNSAISNSGMTRAYPAAELVSPKRMRGGGLVGMGDTAMGNGLMPGVVGIGGGGGMSAGALASPANRITADGLARSNGDLSSLSPVALFNGAQRGRKSGAVEKVVERRQKRMIKNRESAARSRARKQAYTMELEAEIAKLKEQNEDLQKKQVDIMEMQKNQVLEVITQQHSQRNDA